MYLKKTTMKGNLRRFYLFDKTWTLLVPSKMIEYTSNFKQLGTVRYTILDYLIGKDVISMFPAKL